MPKDLLRLDQLTRDEVLALLRDAIKLERDFTERRRTRLLEGLRIGLIVDDSGWRNTTALDLGATILGATCIRVPVSLVGKESIGDLANYLDNWFDLIAIRTPSLDRLTELAFASRRPVVNLRTRDNHPFETLGDLSFVQRERGSLDGLIVCAMAPADNIIHSWVEAASVLPIELIQVAPRPHWVDRERYPAARLTQTEDLAAAQCADVLITDCWPTDGEPDVWRQYTINRALLDAAKPDLLFIPCPPVSRGKDVSADAMTHPACKCFSAKAYLMHAQNAFLVRALSRN